MSGCSPSTGRAVCEIAKELGKSEGYVYARMRRKPEKYEDVKRIREENHNVRIRRIRGLADKLVLDYLEGLPFGGGKLFVVSNYLEAVGVMTAFRAGVALSSVRRPLGGTVVVCEDAGGEDEEVRGEGVCEEVV